MATLTENIDRSNNKLLFGIIVILASIYLIYLTVTINKLNHDTGYALPVKEYLDGDERYPVKFRDSFPVSETDWINRYIMIHPKMDTPFELTDALRKQMKIDIDRNNARIKLKAFLVRHLIYEICVIACLLIISIYQLNARRWIFLIPFTITGYAIYQFATLQLFSTIVH